MEIVDAMVLVLFLLTGAEFCLTYQVGKLIQKVEKVERYEKDGQD